MIFVEPNLDIEEILTMSLDAIDLVDKEGEGSSLWILQNVQRFNRMMGVSLECMEERVFTFFLEN